MPHIIGTAGHIDHGKTALIRALTGLETDRLKEEKERGISIDLGFAYLDLPGGERAGIIDVPGHERFIHNMLAGAHGIDVVLLVVAADDGVMPQTEEHLDIVHLLGVERGVVAVTKTDLVDEARVKDVHEEVQILLAGTTLEGSPVIPVSSITGTGIDALRAALEERLRHAPQLSASGYFRLPVDRAFVMHGHGTVITGTAIGGAVHPGDTVRILPGAHEARVRTVQVHGSEVAEAIAGQRVALNLAGVERVEATRGHVVCDPRLDRATERFDVWMELRPAARPLRNHGTVRLHIGTAEVLARVVLLDRRSALAPRQSTYAQIVPRHPVYTLRLDRFVLRDESAQRTIGGGVVVHPFAHRHRRDEEGLSERLRALQAATTPAEIVRAVLNLENDFAVETDDLAQAAGLPTDVVVEAVRGDANLRGLPDETAPTACTTTEKWERLGPLVVEVLTAFHRDEPIAAGMEMESLRSRVAPDLSTKTFRTLVDALLGQGLIARDESRLRLPTHRVVLRRDQEQAGGRAEALLVTGGFTPPSLKQIEGELGMPRQRLLPILKQLEREGRVVQVDKELYFASEHLERARNLLREHAEAHGQIDAATFRNILGASRKFSIGLLDYFDRTGFTLRVGDLRKLRKS
jgi:selenocysteine-specific elongation factor